MRKVLIPKKDYVKELIKIIRVTKDEQKLRNLLSDYHEKDIAEAITSSGSFFAVNPTN